jgi:hypothetical protein
MCLGVSVKKNTVVIASRDSGVAFRCDSSQAYGDCFAPLAMTRLFLCAWVFLLRKTLSSLRAATAAWQSASATDVLIQVFPVLVDTFYQLDFRLS